MTVMLRRATQADAEAAASLLTELGYPSKKDDARDRLTRSLHSATSCVLVAESASEVIGLLNAELLPYFPNGTTICRVTALVVASHHRGHGIAAEIALSRLGFRPWNRLRERRERRRKFVAFHLVSGRNCVASALTARECVSA
jgi:predicted N-acetyltransferase YhbS